MTGSPFVAGDWGTSHLRLYLCGSDGAALGTVTGPGAAAARGRFAETLKSLLEPWTREHGELPVILCGMVGSSIGWSLAPYVACPTRPEEIAAASIGLESGRVRIVPGLSCRNRLNAPDVMRGEETQILGALRSHPELARGRRLLCLPGTHTKWVLLEDGSVREFLTAPTGELFALLATHSILVRDVRDGAAPSAEINTAIFARGLAKVGQSAPVSLLHRLFECRSRRLSGDLSAGDAESFLSGLLVGDDVRGAADLLLDDAEGDICIIGAPDLARLYSQAVTACGRRAEVLEGGTAARAGLVHVRQLLTDRQEAHAR